MTEAIDEILDSGRAESFTIKNTMHGWVADLDGCEGPAAKDIETACDWCVKLFEQCEEETIAEAAELERKRQAHRREIGL